MKYFLYFLIIIQYNLINYLIFRLEEDETTQYPNNSSRNSHYNTLEEKMIQIADAITESQKKFQQSMIKKKL